jgi:polyphosphate kinase
VSAKKATGRHRHELFVNRELSWLEFNARVLEEAQDRANPLMERIRFATIVQSSLDEFFMVRVARLGREVRAGRTGQDRSGMTPSQQLEAISARAHRMVDDLYALLTGELLPALAAEGIRLCGVEEIGEEQRSALLRQFKREIAPVLTPLGVDSARPFPVLASLSLNVAVLLEPEEGSEDARLAVVQVPSGLPGILRPFGGGRDTWVWMDTLISEELPSLFPGQRILASAAFRVTRDSELEIDEDGDRDLRVQIEEQLRRRRRSRFVRLEISNAAPGSLVETLARRLEIDGMHLYRIKGPLDLKPLTQLVDLPPFAHLRYTPAPSIVPDWLEERPGIFDLLDGEDVILHHPYDAYDPVVGFLASTADDPDVLALKMTLYRTSGDSPVIRSLMRAAERGKQVTVMLELRARFDEQSSLQWTRGLEEAGAHVIFGVRRFKTHAKITLVVRRTTGGLKRYVHLGTGNYNDRTARLYTDFGMMTSEAAIGEDASMFFNAVTGYSDPQQMRRLSMAPTQLRDRFTALIRREKSRAEAGQAAEIIAKVNSLVDPGIIEELYAAAAAGVKIRLNVRGICCLRAGLEGVSENIEVVSIVDRYLDHSRIFYFRNGGDEEVYLSSADWMPRNLDRRIELLFPVDHPGCRSRVMGALRFYFQDNVKARRLRSDGSYARAPRQGAEPFQAQVRLREEAFRRKERSQKRSGMLFEPRLFPSEQG